MIRIGHGYDVHTFGDGDHLMLGGVRIQHSRGVIAHSDGDVVLHALCDALFGAAGLGDIGQHFPDTDPAYRGVDSKELLRQTLRALQQRQFGLVNVDITIVAQQPRIHAHKAAMRAAIAAVVGCDENLVNIKATTTEGLGFLGRAEGLAAHAVVLIESQS